MKIVEGFEHRPGTHCGSTAMADLLRHAGAELSEAMVFGLGAGLGFFYIENDAFEPSRLIMGRSWGLEENAAELLGAELVPHRTHDADEAWQRVREALDSDMPVLIQCDLVHLPYWKARTPFNGHRIVAAGYDDATQEVLVADTHFEGLQRVSYADFATARASSAPPMFDGRHVSWVLESGPTADVADAIWPALEKNAAIMEAREPEIAGLGALRRFTEDVVGWRERDDAAWCYRFAYQCIETRGTGGGFFRRLYREFLSEAADIDRSISTQQLGVSMSRTAQAWSTLATYLEAMASMLDDERPDPNEDPSHHVESMAEAVFQFESTFWDRIAVLTL